MQQPGGSENREASVAAKARVRVRLTRLVVGHQSVARPPGKRKWFREPIIILIFTISETERFGNFGWSGDRQRSMRTLIHPKSVPCVNPDSEGKEDAIESLTIIVYLMRSLRLGLWRISYLFWYLFVNFLTPLCVRRWTAWVSEVLLGLQSSLGQWQILLTSTLGSPKWIILSIMQSRAT